MMLHQSKQSEQDGQLVGLRVAIALLITSCNLHYSDYFALVPENLNSLEGTAINGKTLIL
jgi:hypothetical protein